MPDADFWRKVASLLPFSNPASASIMKKSVSRPPRLSGPRGPKTGAFAGLAHLLLAVA